MSGRITKKTSAVIIGNSRTAHFIYSKVKSTVKDTLLLKNDSEFRFLEPGIASINGIKTQVARVLVELTEHENAVKAHSSTVIEGSDSGAIGAALDAAGKLPIILLSDTDTVLNDFDLAVQDVVLRYFNKSKVKVIFNTNVMSVIKKENKYYIVAEQDGAPRRLVGETFIQRGIRPTSDLHGFHNIADTLPYSESRSLNTQVGVFDGNEDLSLADIDTLAKFLAGKSKSYSLPKPYRRTTSGGGHCCFSLGITEQSISGAHTGYRKHTAKLPGTLPTQPTYFVKVIASVSKKIVGISGVLPQDSADLKLFGYLVQETTPIETAKKLIHATTDHAETLYEVLDSL